MRKSNVACLTIVPPLTSKGGRVFVYKTVSKVIGEKQGLVVRHEREPQRVWECKEGASHAPQC
jgi:hypothetical protein